MNAPPLASGGVREVSIDYFFNLVQFVFWVYSGYLFSTSDSNYKYAIIPVIVFAVFDAFEEAKDIIPTAQRITLSQIKRYCCGRNKMIRQQIII